MSKKNDVFAAFRTDKSAEQQGVIVDYGSFRVRLARAGGRNKKFNDVFKVLSQPYRRAIDSDSLPEAQGAKLMADVYAKAVVLNWEVNVGTPEAPKWEVGMYNAEGERVTFNEANVSDLLVALPEFFADIKEGATKLSYFLEAQDEADEGN